MSSRTHRLFLLRAYGDATIALHFLANSPEKNNYTVIASNHLKPLINALSKYIDLSSLNIEFVDFGIIKSQLNLFTNRYFISINTLNQVIKLKCFIKNNPNNGGVDYVEQEKKITLLNLFTKHSFKAIVKKQVYADMDNFFKSAAAIPKLPSTINKVLIVPDARISARRIPENMIEYIKTQLTGTNKSLQVAYYKKDNQPKLQTESQNEVFSYANFEELLALINDNDFIFGSDSLPIHLCNALKKPHYILYPNNGSTAFFTPFSITNECYADFDKFSSTHFPL
jgi:ADP-heptose:LPS heptosyltransferase